MHNHPRSMFHSQSTFVVFLCLLRLIPFQSDFLRIGINRGGKNDLAPDQQVHPSCRRSFLLSIQSVDQWTAMQWAFKRTEMGIGLTRMLSTVHHACKVHDIRYFQMEGLVLLPCNQSVAVNWGCLIYCALHLLKPVDNDFGDAPFVLVLHHKGSYHNLWLNKTSHWWFGLALSRWSAQ